MIASLRFAAPLAVFGAVLLTSGAESQPGGSIAVRPAPSASVKVPKISARCVAPGSTRPVACVASQGSQIELVAAGALADAPPVLTLREVGSGRQTRVQVKWFVDHSMAVKTRVAAARQLCRGSANGQQLQFEIQVATSDLNQAQSGTAESVGFFQMRC